MSTKGKSRSTGLTPMHTIGEGAKKLLDIMLEGDQAECPCCSQTCAIYPRGLYDKMAAWLVFLVRTYEVTGTWVDIKAFPVRGGDYAKLVYWGMAELSPATPANKRTSGMWRPTDKGIDFVYHRIQVPSHVLLYNGKVCAVEGTVGVRPAREYRGGWCLNRISIIDALGEKWDYRSLLDWAPGDAA